jgi:hypothetical protein
MGVLIVGGTVALGVVLVKRMNAAGSAVGAGPWVLAGQPAGTRMLSLAAAESGLAVLVARPDGERVLLLDVKQRRVVGEILLQP